MIRKTTLDNGIRVISEKVEGVHSVSLGVWVENGSRHESPENNGISHFIEHMLFKGTRSRSAQDIAREIDSVGGLLNAFTSREYSCFFAKVLGDKLTLALDLLSDILLDSVFDAGELEKERNVILQEIHMVSDMPEDYVHDLFYRTLWQDHPLGLPVLGTLDSVSGLSRETILSALRQRYCGKRILVTAAGDLDHDEVAGAIESAFAALPGGEGPAVCSLPVYHPHFKVLERDLEQAHICFGTKSLPQNHDRRYEAYLLNALLGSSMSSRLFQGIREEKGLAYSIYSYLNCHSDAGAMVIYAGTAPEKAFEVVDLVLKEMRRLKEEAVSEQELRRVQEQLKGTLYLSQENTDSRMTRLAKNEIYFGRHVPIDEVAAGFDNVSAASLLEMTQRLFEDESLNIQMVGKVPASNYPTEKLSLS
ncbi:MAG: insulinase family protein [Desulfuromonadales bacterium]|nr:insulinase family protein [Desulfuromonadales bacterium]NIR33781.1 insulinase family protein [Desulfuromonadales bacterium]NIS42465.1 insulinase family protein [Desulfuromonadales bacterium]